jgi:hypothetical protein
MPSILIGFVSSPDLVSPWRQPPPQQRGVGHEQDAIRPEGELADGFQFRGHLPSCVPVGGGVEAEITQGGKN